jgi:DDE superfamily endonuclease
LQDNFSGHIVPNNLQNIRVENFKPNLTAHIQPKDQGIIHCFKAHYHTRFIQQAINCYDEGITPANIYEISQLQAMQLAELAWQDVNTTTIRNCWHKAGILPEMYSSSTCTNQSSIPISMLLDHPSSQMDSVTHAEKQVEAALDDLVTTGALQETNRMDIDSLLNPVGESHNLTETSDNEIYQVVINAINACANIEINSRDDVDDVFLEPHPTRRDLLKATSTITQYTEEMDDPIARKLEALLGTFNRQLRLDETRGMKSTFLTDFFQRA